MVQGDVRYETTKNKLWKDVGTNDWVKIFSEAVHLETSDPTGLDGTNDGLHIDSLWINTTSGDMFLCTATTATTSTWISIGGGGGGSGDFLADGSVPMTGNLDMNTKILLDAYVNGTNGTGFIIDQDNVGAAVDTSITFERGVSTNSTIDCSGATGSITLVTGGGGELYVSATTLTTKANVFILDSDYDSTDISIRMQRTVSTYASMFWDESDAEMKFYSDGATNALANIKCASIKAQAGIILDADETTPKTKIFDEGSTGTKNMVFEVKTGQSFVFRTVA